MGVSEAKDWYNRQSGEGQNQYISPSDAQAAIDQIYDDMAIAGEDEVYMGVTPPPSPTEGMLWIDTTNASTPSMNVYKDATWVLVSAGGGGGSGEDEVFVGPNPPSTPFPGQVWIQLTLT